MKFIKWYCEKDMGCSMWNPRSQSKSYKLGLADNGWFYTVFRNGTTRESGYCWSNSIEKIQEHIKEGRLVEVPNWRKRVG